MAKAARRLSARAAETITDPGYHADGDGLYLRVDPSGARRWAFIFFTNGKRREMGLGRMGLKEAREKADEVRRQVRAGLDPILTRQTARSTKAASRRSAARLSRTPRRKKLKARKLAGRTVVFDPDLAEYSLPLATEAGTVREARAA